jgi:hypothetical protein
MKKLIGEALVVGVVTVVIGFVVDKVLKMYDNVNISQSLGKEFFIRLFFIGLLAHFSFEFLGLNKWYCTHGNACLQ